MGCVIVEGDSLALFTAQMYSMKIAKKDIAKIEELFSTILDSSGVSKKN